MTPDALHRAKTWLTSADLRPTRQRLSLATLLVGEGQNRHVTAEGLHEAVLATDDKVSLATVYNTLRVFCSVGLMQEVIVDGGGGRSHFDTRVDDHPHFYIEDRGYLIDAPGTNLNIENIPDIPEGYAIAKIDVFIRLRKI